MRIRGRRIVGGYAEGEALISHIPFSFYGGVNPETGVVIEKGNPLEGVSVADRVFIFPHGKGSTVGCYVIYRMRKLGTAPIAIINLETEVIIATGCAMARIPLLDRLEVNPLDAIKTGDHVKVHANEGYIIL